MKRKCQIHQFINCITVTRQFQISLVIYEVVYIYILAMYQIRLNIVFLYQETLSDKYQFSRKKTTRQASHWVPVTGSFRKFLSGRRLNCVSITKEFLIGVRVYRVRRLQRYNYMFLKITQIYLFVWRLSKEFFHKINDILQPVMKTRQVFSTSSFSIFSQALLVDIFLRLVSQESPSIVLPTFMLYPRVEVMIVGSPKCEIPPMPRIARLRLYCYCAPTWPACM